MYLCVLIYAHDMLNCNCIKKVNLKGNAISRVDWSKRVLAIEQEGTMHDVDKKLRWSPCQQGFTVYNERPLRK